MSYLDRSFFQNPLMEYFKWLINKSKYQLKYWGKHLRIGYKSKVFNSDFDVYNWIANDVILINSSLGKRTYIQSGASISNCTIGAFCSIGPNVIIGPGKHPTTDFVSSHPSLFSNPPNLINNFVSESVFKNYDEVNIGSDVWIAANSIILDGVKIGHGAIVAANSVVTKDVAPYSIVGGTPAKIIKFRFSDEQIASLINFKWWEKDDDWIRNNISLFWSIEKFVDNINLKL